MGLGLGGNSSCDCKSSTPVVVKVDCPLFNKCKSKPTYSLPSTQNKSKLPNPNPRNFKIEKMWIYGSYTVIVVRYPDCTNFEGRKVMVYEDVPKEWFDNVKFLDPHFCDNKHHSPIARFVPTNGGIKAANQFAASMSTSKALTKRK